MRLTFRCAAIALTLLAEPVAAQVRQPTSTKPAKFGAIEGDIYYTNLDGETTAGSGQAVYLLQSTVQLYREHVRFCDALTASTRELDSAYAQSRKGLSDTINILDAASRGMKTSAEYVAYVARTGLDTMLARSSASTRDYNAKKVALEHTLRDTLLRIVQRSAARSVLVGLNAHYRFADLDSGFYDLFALWQLRGEAMPFWTTAHVESGEAVTADLSRYWKPDGLWQCRRFNDWRQKYEKRQP